MLDTFLMMPDNCPHCKQKEKKTLVLSCNVWDFILSADITNNHFAARLIPC